MTESPNEEPRRLSDDEVAEAIATYQLQDPGEYSQRNDIALSALVELQQRRTAARRDNVQPRLSDEGLLYVRGVLESSATPDYINGIATAWMLSAVIELQALRDEIHRLEAGDPELWEVVDRPPGKGLLAMEIERLRKREREAAEIIEWTETIAAAALPDETPAIAVKARRWLAAWKRPNDD